MQWHLSCCLPRAGGTLQGIAEHTLAALHEHPLLRVSASCTCGLPGEAASCRFASEEGFPLFARSIIPLHCHMVKLQFLRRGKEPPSSLLSHRHLHINVLSLMGQIQKKNPHLHLKTQLTSGPAVDVSIHLQGSLLQAFNFALAQMCQFSALCRKAKIAQGGMCWNWHFGKCMLCWNVLTSSSYRRAINSIYVHEPESKTGFRKQLTHIKGLYNHYAKVFLLKTFSIS